MLHFSWQMELSFIWDKHINTKSIKNEIFKFNQGKAIKNNANQFRENLNSILLNVKRYPTFDFWLKNEQLSIILNIEPIRILISFVLAIDSLVSMLATILEIRLDVNTFDPSSKKPLSWRSGKNFREKSRTLLASRRY